MTDDDKTLWRVFAAALRDDTAEIARLEKQLAEYRLAVANTRLRLKCLEQGVDYQEIPQ